MIKPLIRECLTELFLEMKLENIIETVVHKKKRPSFKDAMAPAPTKQSAKSKEAARKIMTEDIKKRLGVDDSVWETVYADVGDNSVLGDDQSGAPVVPEAALESRGLFEDYSRFVEDL